MRKLTTLIFTVICMALISVCFVGCGHQHILSKHEANSASCSQDGNSVYYSCDCGKFFADSEGKTEIAKYSWIIAKKAHDTTKTEAVFPTCTEAGNMEYYSCDCGKIFADSEGNKELPADFITLEAKNHKNFLAHQFTLPTCTEDGNLPYFECMDCGKCFADLSRTNEVEKNAWVISAFGHTHSELSYAVENGIAYQVNTCGCGDQIKTELVDIVVVTPETVQQALDNAQDNTTILLTNGTYQTLYLRKTDSSEQFDSDWAGAGPHSFKRTISGLTILGEDGVHIRKIKAEALMYTPSGNQHSNSATAPYLNFHLTINNLKIENIVFELIENDVAVDILNGQTTVDGLHIKGCSFIDKYEDSTATNGSRALCSDSQTAVKENIIVEDCIFSFLHQGIKLNNVTNLKVTNNTFEGVKLHAILLSGGSTSNLSKDGTIIISDNVISVSIGDRFLRATAIADTAVVTIQGNYVSSNTTLGADPDIIKLTTVSNSASITIDDSNYWVEKL